jgi:hypothetical protein
VNNMASSAAFTRHLRAITGANVTSHAAFSSRILSEPLHAWWRRVTKRLNELCQLNTGWDGYRASPVSFMNANFAASVLASACLLDTPEPQIVPGTNGDLQIEWHTEAADIELHVRAPYDVRAWRTTQTAPEEDEEIHLTTDFAIVARWLAELSEAPIAARSSAA